VRALFERQLAKATLESGAVDLDALAEMVDAAYEEADRDLRRTDRSIKLMVQELESFRLLFDENPIPMWVVDQDTHKFLAVNNAAVSHYGYSRERFLEITPFDIRPPEDREEFRHFVLKGDWTQGGTPRRHVKADGSLITVVVYARTIVHDGRPAWLSAIIDITERNRAEERIRYMAHHDLLTGLPNRALFLERTESASARLRQRGDRFAVFVLDLDRFKDVNDSLGHPAGDAILKDTARRLKSVLDEAEVLARLGGDEFAILQPIGADGREDAAAFAERIVQAIAVPYEIEGSKIVVGTSIGIALAPADGVEPNELMKQADLALYRQKSAGRDGYRFFDARMTVDADARLRLVHELRDAISNDELELHYQIFVDVKTGEPRGAEALVRWAHPRRGNVPPTEFIPLAEESGLIVPLGEWVLQRACADAATWPSHVKVAVNLSPSQFKKGNLLDVIMCTLVETGLPPERLELEITESVLIESHIDVVPVIRQLKNLGISIALDDFGTGYSSLSYLTMFPFEKIKIDQTFVRNLMKRAECRAIISSVLALGRGLGIAITAEGVETQEQFELLSSYGVDSIQGFLLGLPCPRSQLDFSRIRPGQPAANAA
jgi:diguanylate cyclase (GGDEF)-like protein/PAS domain S-box-containing protein